jgi:hypothetical protein
MSPARSESEHAFATLLSIELHACKGRANEIIASRARDLRALSLNIVTPILFNRADFFW